MTQNQKTSGDGSPDTSLGDTLWYLALRKLHIHQGPGVVPSTIRFIPGQRFALDGDEPVDVESLLRTRSIKIYEDADEQWARDQLANAPKPTPRRNRG